MLKPSTGPWKLSHTRIQGFRVSDSTGWGVAVVLKDTNDEANARLIAAAPVMLEALQKILAVKRTVDLNLFNIEEIHSIAEAALRAAERGE